MSSVSECRVGEWVEDGGCGRMRLGGRLCLIGEMGAWLSLGWVVGEYGFAGDGTAERSGWADGWGLVNAG